MSKCHCNNKAGIRLGNTKYSLRTEAWAVTGMAWVTACGSAHPPTQYNNPIASRSLGICRYNKCLGLGFSPPIIRREQGAACSSLGTGFKNNVSRQWGIWAGKSCHPPNQGTMSPRGSQAPIHLEPGPGVGKLGRGQWGRALGIPGWETNWEGIHRSRPLLQCLAGKNTNTPQWAGTVVQGQAGGGNGNLEGLNSNGAVWGK